MFSDLKAFSNSLRKNSAILVLSVVMISATLAYETPLSYDASAQMEDSKTKVSIIDIESLFTKYEKGLISSDEFAQKLKQLHWTDTAIRKALMLDKKWTDTDSLGHHAASPMVDGLDLLTKPKLESVSEQSEPVKQVEKENIDYDEGETKSPQELGVSQEKPSSPASSDSPQDIVTGMIIAGVVLVSGLIIALVKTGII